jgi:hypothetical protein
MPRKIVNFGVVLPCTVYDMYKIIQHVYTHKLHVIKFLKLS